MFGSSRRSASAALLLCGGFALLASSGASERVREPFLFDHDILPLFERMGCSSAYCHGAATGRGGLKLSLFGSDPRADHAEITEEFGGRRLDLVDAHESILLKKPTQRIAHGGGRRLDRRGPAYRILRDWIAEGAPYRVGDPGRVVGLALVRDGERLRATASFARGDERFERDVTELARYWSSNDEMVAVDQRGSVEVRGTGEAFLFARYAGRTARIPVRRPFAKGAERERVPGFVGAWRDRLAGLGLDAAAPADDHTLLRRIYLDLADRGPTPSEIRAFFRARAETRVGDTVQRLLDAPSFAAVWGRHLASWLEVPPPGKSARNRIEVHARLRSKIVELVGKRVPLTAVVPALVETDGALRQLVAQHGDPRDRAEFVGRALLGVRIGCARCHDHPLDRWRLDDHMKFSAFFVDRRPDPMGGGMRSGIFFHPETREPVKPELLPAGTGAPPRGASVARKLGWFVLEGGHDMFARAFANRVFGVLHGRGLVEPFDDHRLSNPAKHEAVLAALADELRRVRYDLRAFVRAIMTSPLYALASTERAGESREVEWFARRAPLSIAPLVVHKAAASALGVPAGRTPLPDSPLAFQLALRNGSLLSDLLATDGNQVDAIFAFGGTPAEQLAELYHLLLARPPKAAERKRFLPRLGAAADPIAFGRDLAFALLASREFGSKR